MKSLTWVEVEPVRRPAPSKTHEDQLRRQLVQTERGQLVKEAAKDAFLGERTQTVDRQTVSKSRSLEVAQAAARQKVPAARQAQLEQESLEKSLKKGALSALGLPILPATRGIDPSAFAQDSHAWAPVESLPQDYVKGMAQSARTALNTKEYVFYGYFQRIRERLDRAWVPLLREKLVRYHRTGRQLASDMEHTTRLVVTLSPEGEIVRVRVLSESGSSDLDDAAVNAFNRAGPFPNPPRGIVDKNGQIEIPWEFILRT